MNCNPQPTDTPGIFRCPECGKQNPRPIKKPFLARCGVLGPPRKPVDLAPLLARLADATAHPEIVDQPNIYGRAVQIWAAGVVIYGPSGAEACRIEPFEIRDNDEVREIENVCRKNVCKKHQDGVCRPSCGPGMIVAVMARMASQGCPWTGKGGQGPRW